MFLDTINVYEWFEEDSFAASLSFDSTEHVRNL